MATDIAPIVTICRALANLVEAIQALEPEPARKKAFEASLLEVRRARSELRLWVEGNR